MAVLRDILARFGIDVDAGPLEEIDKGIGGVVGSLQQMGQVLAAGFAINGLHDFVYETVAAADDLGDLSERLNVNTNSLQAWGFAAELNGLSAEEMANGLGFLQRSLAGAVSGNATARQAFSRMGVQLEDTAGVARDLDAVLLDVAAAVQRQPDPARRAAMAVSVFGRSGAALVPMLARGAEGLAELRAEYVRLGGGATEEMIERSSQLTDDMARLDVVTYSLRTRLVNLLLPALIAGTERTIAFAQGFLEMAENSNILEAGIVVLGAIAVAAGLAVSAAWLGPILVFAAVALAVTFLILLVDDLITLFHGGTSVIGHFIDEMFGVGTAAEVVQYLTDAWNGLTMAIGEAVDAVGSFFGADAPDRVGDETITHTRGIAPGTGITGEEGERRAARRRDPAGAARDAVLADLSTRGGGGSTTTNVTNHTEIAINGGDPAEVRRVMTDVMRSERGAAGAALAEEAEGT
jgi:hypothetical protein